MMAIQVDGPGLVQREQVPALTLVLHGRHPLLWTCFGRVATLVVPQRVRTLAEYFWVVMPASGCQASLLLLWHR